jgi:Skp family chaperone for outer membrane proteins
MNLSIGRDEEDIMNRWLVIAVVLLLGLPGCMVSKSKYEASVADMESAKAELEKSRMHQEALEEQIRNLKGLNEKVSTDLETMTTEVQRIKEGRKNEHTLLETRERELDQEKEQLTSKLRVVVDQYQKVKAQNTALKETVVRYQKELKDTRESSVGMAAGGMKPSENLDMSKSGIAPPVTSSPIVSSKPPVPKIVTSPTLPKMGGDLVNINKAPVSDMVLTLGLTREVAEEVVSNRPYRLRGELVANNIIPKATFDEIKDRITASP